MSITAMPGFYMGPGYPFIWLLHAWASDTLLSELYLCLLIQLSFPLLLFL